MKETEEIKELWNNYHSSRSIEDRNRLVEHYIPLARKVAISFCKDSRSLDDIYSYALVGLINAVEKCNKELKDCKSFQSYAYIRIRGAIQDGFRNDYPLTRGEYERGWRLHYYDMDDYTHEIAASVTDRDLQLDMPIIYEAMSKVITEYQLRLLIARYCRGESYDVITAREKISKAKCNNELVS